MIEIFFGVIEFLKLLIPLTIFIFVLTKIISPVRDKLKEKYSLSWLKSTVLINFLIIFSIILIIYLYFFMIGFSLAVPQGESISYTAFENLLMVGLGLIRIFIASVILALTLLFFEVFSGIASTIQKEKSEFVQELTGVTISIALFLILFLFFFNWVPLGLVVFIFYGSINELPLLFPLLSLIISL